MHFVVIDDNAIHRELISDRIAEVCGELVIPYDIALITDRWQEVMAYAADAPENTIYLLDIQLEDETNGIELRRKLHEVDQDGYIVYVSAYEHYALECCQSHAFDFLLKPWTTEQLRDCIRAIREDMARRETGTWLTITMGSRTLRLQQEEILYLSKKHNSVTIHLASGDTIQYRTSFSALLKSLKSSLFIQCHKSYIVQRNAVREFRWDDDELLLNTGETLPISRRRCAEIKAAMVESGRVICK